MVQSNGDILLGGLGSWVVTAAALAILCYWNRQDALTASQNLSNRSGRVQTGYCAGRIPIRFDLGSNSQRQAIDGTKRDERGEFPDQEAHRKWEEQRDKALREQDQARAGQQQFPNHEDGEQQIPFYDTIVVNGQLQWKSAS